MGQAGVQNEASWPAGKMPQYSRPMFNMQTKPNSRREKRRLSVDMERRWERNGGFDRAEKRSQSRRGRHPCVPPASCRCAKRSQFATREGARGRHDWVRLYERGCIRVPTTSMAAVRSDKRVRSPALRRTKDRVNAELRTERASAAGPRAKRSQFPGRERAGKRPIGFVCTNPSAWTDGMDCANNGPFVGRMFRIL